MHFHVILCADRFRDIKRISKISKYNKIIENFPKKYGTITSSCIETGKTDRRTVHMPAILWERKRKGQLFMNIEEIKQLESDAGTSCGKGTGAVFYAADLY